MRANATNWVAAVGWPLHGWSRGDLLALAGIVTAIVIAVVPPLRRWLARWWWAGFLSTGSFRRAYARWFIRTWGSYENPYLDDKENLDLSNTYVPLSFRSDQEGREMLSVATAVLDNRGAGNLAIEGVPGSGKSTLLKAYGVGVLQSSLFRPRNGQIVPFLVQLRKLARYSNEQISIADYLVNQILVSSVGMNPARAWLFLRYALAKDQVLVMFDGLDEVTTDRYRGVQEAVYSFAHDHSPDCPSYRARIIVTCRRQNFMKLRDEWVPAIANTVCSLAPLRNSEIFSYLNKLRPKFRKADGPESFFQAVRASGTLELHRVPLVLAMSVGLYARKDYFEIPSSIARLYQVMIEEMLDRHRFKRDPVGAALVFLLDDKYRFLREFALHAAGGGYGFDEFSKAELIEFGRLLAPDLDAVADPIAFVEEIIQRSGLLTDVGETGTYVFAHRSIQEFLVAEELRFADDDRYLLDKANDPEWRQVVQFYSAGLEQRQANAFLPALSQRNEELAGYCLAGARVSDHEARTVLKTLSPVDGVRLAALAAATMSPRVSVQRMAIEQLEHALSSADSPLAAISGDVDALLPLLNSLAGTNAAQIAGMVPQLIQHISDDPRLVEPLWRCLTAPGINALPASRTIVERLLTLATSLDGFEELARQETYMREFLTEDVRRRAYPFANGLGPNHNLVTLLAWADYLGVMPAELNRYFDAKAADLLGRIESDRRRSVVVSLFWPGIIISTVITLGVIISATIVLVTEPGRVLHPFGWWNLALDFGLIIVPFAIWFSIFDKYNKEAAGSSPVKRFITTGEGESAQIMEYLTVKVTLLPDNVMFILWFAILIAIPFAFTPLLGISIVAYCGAAVSSASLYLGIMFDGFAPDRHYYLYRPNAFIDVYDDPRSRHWLVVTAR